MISGIVLLTQQLKYGQDKVTPQQNPIQQESVFQISPDSETISRPINRDYSMSMVVQKDQFGESKIATHKATQLKRLIKVVPKTVADLNSIMNGLKIFSKLDHPNIAKFDILYETQGSYYIVIQPAIYSELFDHIIDEKKFNEKLASETMFQIFSVVSYLHSKGIAHQDIKPEGFMYNQPARVDLLMTGFSYLQELKLNEKISQIIGQEYYIAPEVLNNSHDLRCDDWSCGVILYILLSGTPPFNDADIKIIHQKIMKGVYSFPEEDWSSISEDAKDLINQLLQLNPEKRITAKQALNHPWIQKYKRNSVDRNPILRTIEENVKVLKSANKIQRNIWHQMANQIQYQRVFSDQIQVFQQLDKNNESYLTKEILQQEYNLLIGEQEANILVNQIFEIFDKNQNNLLDYSEYVAAATSKNTQLDEETLKTTFKWIDDNKDGKIDFIEFNKKIKDKTLTEETWIQLIDEYDTDKDNQLNETEFLSLMNKLNQQE